MDSPSFLFSSAFKLNPDSMKSVNSFPPPEITDLGDFGVVLFCGGSGDEIIRWYELFPEVYSLCKLRGNFSRRSYFSLSISYSLANI